MSKGILRYFLKPNASALIGLILLISGPAFSDSHKTSQTEVQTGEERLQGNWQLYMDSLFILEENGDWNGIFNWLDEGLARVNEFPKGELDKLLEDYEMILGSTVSDNSASGEGSSITNKFSVDEKASGKEGLGETGSLWELVTTASFVREQSLRDTMSQPGAELGLFWSYWKMDESFMILHNLGAQVGFSRKKISYGRSQYWDNYSGLVTYQPADYEEQSLPFYLSWNSTVQRDWFFMSGGAVLGPYTLDSTYYDYSSDESGVETNIYKLDYSFSGSAGVHWGQRHKSSLQFNAYWSAMQNDYLGLSYKYSYSPSPEGISTWLRLSGRQKLSGYPSFSYYLAEVEADVLPPPGLLPPQKLYWMADTASYQQVDVTVHNWYAELEHQLAWKTKSFKIGLQSELFWQKVMAPYYSFHFLQSLDGVGMTQGEALPDGNAIEMGWDPGNYFIFLDDGSFTALPLEKREIWPEFWGFKFTPFVEYYLSASKSLQLEVSYQQEIAVTQMPGEPWSPSQFWEGAVEYSLEF
jgi:hypothetical protein